jgi:membrane protein
MRRMWTLGGLSIGELVRYTWLETWRDAVYGQAGRMAFYHFLAIFPCLLLFLAVCSSIPVAGKSLQPFELSVAAQVLPPDAAALISELNHELEGHAYGFGLLASAVGALWAAMNGTWALIFGLNVAYEVEEDRSWRELGITIVGLTLSLALAGGLTLVLLWFAVKLESHVFRGALPIGVTILEWLAVLALLTLSFAVIFRFAPNLKDAEWKWSTPGSVCSLLLWVLATFGLRFYFGHVTNYYRSYGHLNSVVMLMLWLYLTNAAILIGGEMNSAIEKAAAGSSSRRHSSPVVTRG